MSTERSSSLRVALSWLPAVMYIALIWWLSSRVVALPPNIPGGDKTVHFFEYGVLGACFAFAVFTTWPGRGMRGAVVASLSTIGAGLLDELHQSIVPGRDGNLLDLAADASGALLFVTGTFLILLRRREQADHAPEIRVPSPAQDEPANQA